MKIKAKWSWGVAVVFVMSGLVPIGRAGEVAPAVKQPAEKPTGIPGKIVAVTLYRGQAQVTRRVPITGAIGAREIIVANLPPQIISSSLYAEGSDAVEIRAVRFRARVVALEQDDAIRKLDAEIEAVNDKVNLAQRLTRVYQQRARYLDKLENFVVPTAKTDLAKGVLDAAALEKITAFSFANRDKITREILQREMEIRNLRKQLRVLNRKRGEIQSRASKTVYEAVLFLDKKNAAATHVRLRYIVRNAGWSPAYNLRAQAKGKAVEMEYNAIIHQATGESWREVALTLSTASPRLSTDRPGLAPFRVMLSSAAAPNAPGKKDLRYSQKRLQSINEKRARASLRQQISSGVLDNRNASWDMNAAAAEMQGYELAESDDDKSASDTGGLSVGAEGEQMSFRYALAGKVSLSSRADTQIVRIIKTSLATEMYHVATPVLTSLVYREAKLKNASANALLNGPASVYLDGRFVGMGTVPTVAQGASFVIGFGADSQLRARREKVKRTDKKQGGNRSVHLQFRLVLDNFKITPVAVRIYDRQPLPSRGSDIRVTLDELKVNLSEDKQYVRVQKNKGILRWDVTVPARASGDAAHLLDYGYTMEFARNFSVVDATGTDRNRAAKARREFEQMEDKTWITF